MFTEVVLISFFTFGLVIILASLERIVNWLNKRRMTRLERQRAGMLGWKR